MTKIEKYNLGIALGSVVIAMFSFWFGYLDRKDNLKPTIAVSDIFLSASDRNGTTLLQKNSYGETTLNKDGVIANYQVSLKFSNASRYPGYVKLDNYQSILNNHKSQSQDNFIFFPFSNTNVDYFVPAGKEVGPIYAVPLSDSETNSSFSIPIFYSVYDLDNKFIYKIEQSIECVNGAPRPSVNLNCRILSKK